MLTRNDYINGAGSSLHKRHVYKGKKKLSLSSSVTEGGD